MSHSQTSSWQDVQRHRQHEEFVGRQDFQIFFRRNLRLNPENEEKRFIINISGQGGVGKTWLVRRFRKITEESGVVSAYVNETSGSIPDVLKRIADQFEAQGYKLKSFSNQYWSYVKLTQEHKSSSDTPHDVSGSVGRFFMKGGLQLARMVPYMGMIADSLGEETVVDFGGKIATYFAGKSGNKPDLRQPEVALTSLFLQDARDLAETKPIAIFLDTFERTGSFLDEWLRQLIDGDFGPVSTNISIVIAGRNTLKKDLWSQYEGLIARLPLEPFSREEAIEYLRRKGITDEATVAVILHSSGRLPLFIAMLATKNPDNPNEVGDLSDDALGRFLKWIEDAEQRRLAVEAAVPRYINRDVIIEIGDSEKADDLFDWLKEMPFVEKFEPGWIYHDVVRFQMLRYKRTESPQGWSELQKRLAKYYEKARDDLGLAENDARIDATWQRHTIEAIYHRLCQAPQVNLDAVLRSFVANFKTSYLIFNICYVYAIHDAGLDIEGQELQEWGRLLYKGLAGYWNGKYDQTIDMFTSLMNHVEFTPEERANILDWRGYLYSSIGDYHRALEDLDEAIRLDPNEAEYWVDRGRTYMLMTKHNEALVNLNKAYDLAPKSTWALRIRAQNFVKMNHSADALIDYNQIVEQEPDNIEAIFQRGEILWRIGQSVKALNDLNQVLKSNPKNSRGYVLRGEILWQLGMYNEALIDFSKAIDIDPTYVSAIVSRAETHYSMENYDDALADFDRAVELNPNYARAYAGRGEAHRRKNNLENALADCNQAGALDPNYSSVYAYRGIILFQKGEYHEALSDLDHAVELQPTSDWYLYNRFLINTKLNLENAQLDLAQAIELAQNKFESTPDDWRNSFNLALYYLAVGEIRKAEHLYRLATTGKTLVYQIRDAARDMKDFIEVFPDNTQAHEILNLLQLNPEDAEKI